MRRALDWLLPAAAGLFALALYGVMGMGGVSPLTMGLLYLATTAMAHRDWRLGVLVGAVVLPVGAIATVLVLSDLSALPGALLLTLLPWLGLGVWLAQPSPKAGPSQR